MCFFRGMIAAAIFALAIPAGFGLPDSPAAAKPSRLLPTSAPVLVDCAPVTTSPCMAVGLTPVDDAGHPAPFSLPASSELVRAFTLHGEDRDLHPFYAGVGPGADAAQHGSVSLLLVDISGSMRQPAPGSPSRFAAVKTAIGAFLAGMQEGSDRIAIVPFESHNVVATIRGAVYATTKADAMAQLDALTPPASDHNTALYQAVFTGVQSLGGEVAAARVREGASVGIEPHLIVLTDGKNEVLPGDDPQLLNGPLGLQQASAQVQAGHMDVIAVGFGDRTGIDAGALRRLSTRFFYAEDAGQLLQALHVSRALQSHEIQLAWMLPETDRLGLMGRDPTWIPEMRLSSGAVLPGTPLTVPGPAAAAPVYDRKAEPAELSALIATQPPADAGWSVTLLTCIEAFAFGTLALILWFWVPRLVWGDRYATARPGRSKRWTSDRPGVTSASGVQIRSASVPQGFEPAGAGGAPLQRSAAQTTQLQPRAAFSRTRLTFDQK